MAEEILLDYVLDQPVVATTQSETQLKALLKINASPRIRAAAEVRTRSHLCLVLDVSSSMGDRDIRELRNAAKRVVEMLHPGDVLSLIAFQSVVYEVLQGEVMGPAGSRDAVLRKIDIIEHYRGGGTDMELALRKAEHQLNVVNEAGLTRKVLLLTDGRVDGIEGHCLRQAEAMAERGISLDGLGFGKDFDYKFMQRLVSFGNGFTGKIDRPEELSKVFGERVERLTNAVANQVRMKLTFTHQVRAGRGYRYSPEMMYLGTIRLPGDERSIEIPVGSIERDREYSYLVTFTVPQREVGDARAIKAELLYDVPALGVVNGQSQQSIVVRYSDDPDEATVFNGEVERAFDEVEIGRMVEELDRAMQQDDNKRVLLFLDVLARRYAELGDREMADHYDTLKQRFVQDKKLSMEDMNYNRHRSTQKKDGGVKLVDASDLF